MILIITNSSDVTAEFVTRELTVRGAQYVRLNTDEFPQHIRGFARFPPEEQESAKLYWPDSGVNIDWSIIRSVWYRRPVAPIPSSQIENPAIRKFATDESYEFLRGLWLSLNCKWVSHPDAIRRAEHKLVQLRTATSIGFNIPRTVVTNEPAEIISLWNSCKSGLVVKPLYLGFIGDPDEPKFIYTTQISANDLERIDSASLSPSIYQERINKEADIRVTIVGNRVFAAKIVAPALPDQIPDWRYTPHENLQQEAHSLPPHVESLCIKIVKHLGLLFGAIDLGLTHNGDYIFFEINPNGQWAWLENDVGLRISSAIADELLEP